MIQKIVTSLAIAAALSGCANAPESSNSSCNQSTICCSDSAKITTADQAIAELIAGNERFATGKMVSPRADSLRLVETLNSQKPFAAVIACSDSRVPVELLFDQGIGDLFVIRTAGNTVMSDVVMGSVDYAIDHLDVPLVVVLGHQNCGGVTGAITASDHEHAHHHNGKIGELLEAVRHHIKDYVGKHDSLDEAIRINAKAQAQYIRDVEYINHKVEASKLTVVSAYYSFDTGLVTFDL